MSEIRTANEDDLPEIARIHVLAWHEAYSDLVESEVLSTVTVETRVAAWRQWYESDTQELHVIHQGDEVRGFVRTCPARNRENPPADFGELTHLYLNPSEISTGAGHRLFEFAVSRCKANDYAGMLLWTIEGNRRARRFYEMHGLLTDGARDDDPDWLGEGVNEVRYVLPFGEVID